MNQTGRSPQPLRTRLKARLVRSLPWWLILALGVCCLVLGAVLIARPFKSLTLLHWLVAVGLVLIGISELAGAATTRRPTLTRLVGCVWIATGILAAVWPGITLWTLAVLLGVALVAGGAVKLWAAILGDESDRLLLGTGGATNVVTGALALSWPAATVLVLAAVFGISAVLFGAGQIGVALRLQHIAADDIITDQEAEELVARRQRGPRWLRLAGSLVTLALAVGGMAISVAIHRAAPDEPGPFYTAPSPLPEGEPGTIIRTEVVEGYQAEATTYRVLYLSTGYDGEPTAVSGLILVPDSPAPVDGRKVLAYTHGTVGVASRCAPSLAKASDQPLFHEGGAELLAAGYVVAASDYQGLGTKGPHPYLIGASEAMNELDIVRAARNLPEADASSDFVVWGHSQGGHASLFTGQLAGSYAPELDLMGVAAGAPVPNIIDLFKVNVDTTIGKILISMAFQSWARVYDDAHLSDVLKPAAGPVVERIAENCLYGTAQILASVPSALFLNIAFLSAPPWDVEPWNTIARDNTPGGSSIDVPLLIVQGGADEIVAPTVTDHFADMLCANGESVDYRVYDGVGHLDTGHVAAPDVVSWVADRFAGVDPPTTCQE